MIQNNLPRLGSGRHLQAVAGGGGWGAEPTGHTEPPALGAWILTSALRVGLARYVGQAVRDHSLASTSAKARVVAIGIAPLGRVLHHPLLDDARVSVRLGAPSRPGKLGLGGGEGLVAPKYTHPRVGGTPRKPPVLSPRPTAPHHLVIWQTRHPPHARPARDRVAPTPGGSQAQGVRQAPEGPRY